MEALELLLGAGLDRVQAADFLAGAESSGQRPTSQDWSRDQRSSTRLAEEQGSHQLARGSQLERTVLEIRAKFGERLVSLTAGVEGSNFLSSTSQSWSPAVTGVRGRVVQDCHGLSLTSKMSWDNPGQPRMSQLWRQGKVPESQVQDLLGHPGTTQDVPAVEAGQGP